MACCKVLHFVDVAWPCVASGDLGEGLRVHAGAVAARAEVADVEDGGGGGGRGGGGCEGEGQQRQEQQR